jgi:H+/Cl- antiporter ClcA
MPSVSIVDDHEVGGVRMLPFRAHGRRSEPVAAIVAASAIVVTGVVAGLSAVLLGWLLHLVQHLAYDYSLDAVVSPETFLQGVTAASPMRRVAALTVCGAVAGIGWWAVHRFGPPLVSVKATVGKDAPGPRMPLFATITHVLLQIITVALGSPLGREVAPREMSAVLATSLLSRAGLDAEERRILIACSAGAGLAAIYNVPLGGVFYILEVLLGTLAWKALAPAIATSVIATMVAWMSFGDVPQYLVPPLKISPSLIGWSIVAGPVFGVTAHGFKVVTRAAMARTPQGWHRVPWCLAVFFGVGLLATLFPQLPGNGKGPSQLGFDGDLSVKLAMSLLALKVLAITASLRAGAAGGLLTPSLTLGALLATILGSVWNLVFPGVPTPAFAIVGAAAFLASSMNMPLTAIVLVIEFTHVGQDLWVPITLAVATSVASRHGCAMQRHRAPTESLSLATWGDSGRPRSEGAQRKEAGDYYAEPARTPNPARKVHRPTTNLQ